MKRFIPVAAPALVGNERVYVQDCLDSTWISSVGKYVEQFEAAFARFCGTKYALSACNGTAALHLALMALGVGPGDEVVIPTLTFVATANAVAYCGATPVFVDSEADTWNLDPAKVKSVITSRTKAIICVHLYGHPADMDVINEIAHEYGLSVIEDAAEAHGAEYKNRRAGSLGDIGAFSFYGNKIITTGEGGMVVANDDRLAAKVRQLKGQGMDSKKRYWFPIIGYNYRMTNIQAAIGLAQLEKIDWHIRRRREIASWYREHLRGIPGALLPAEKDWAKNVYWMFNIVLDDDIPFSRDDIMAALQAKGIETRPFFFPIHTLPPYRQLAAGDNFLQAERLAARGLSLPTSATLGKEDIDFVCEALKSILAR